MSDIDAFRQQSSTPGMRIEPVSGIGGWLVFPLLGLLLAPVLNLIWLLALAGKLAGAQLAVPQVATLLLVEIVVTFVLYVLAPIVLLVFFFRKLRVFPPSYIALLAAGAIFMLVDITIGYSLMADYYRENGLIFFDYDMIRSIIGAVLGVAIWIPYMLESERVKNTFVN